MTLNDVTNIAKNEIGYYEKSSKYSNLDVYESDGAFNNWTKYGRDLKTAAYYGNKNKNGYDYCCLFVDWIILKACNGDKAEADAHKPNGIYGSSCKWTKKYFNGKHLITNTAAIGEQVFFKAKDGKLCHTGLVVDMDDTTITVVEGNTGNGKVEAKVYSKNYKYIDSYGIIKYDEPAPEPVELFNPGDKVKLLTEYYSNGKHIAKSVRNRAFLYVISDNGTTVKVSKYANLAYTGAVKKSDLALYE